MDLLHLKWPLPACSERHLSSCLQVLLRLFQSPSSLLGQVLALPFLPTRLHSCWGGRLCALVLSDLDGLCSYQNTHGVLLIVVKPHIVKKVKDSENKGLYSFVGACNQVGVYNSSCRFD